ncbi:HGGxSTG domain-containing protein [Methylobacterium crusticola]|nr:HGGxSTG domain-containing protein [Methylobacterium crusticola]
MTAISADEPYAPDWRAALDHADAAPRCGAHRLDRGSCRQPAMANGRCRMHGGASTGPQTPEGLERSRRSTWKHGRRSAKAIAFRRMLARTVRDLRAATRMVEEQ